MHLQALLWLFLPVIVAVGSAMLSYYIMQARMEVALSKERESLAEARAAIHSHKITMEERIKATEEAARRAALDELMQDIRIEERSYVRDSNTAEGSRRSMVMQERVFFRNLPMSSWSEREMLIEEGPSNSLSERTPSEHTDDMSGNMLSAGPLPVAPVPVAIDSHRGRTASVSGVPQPETRIAVSKVLDKTPVKAMDPEVSAPPSRPESRTLVAVHAAFGSQ
jgi:hypothetical protein